MDTYGKFPIKKRTAKACSRISQLNLSYKLVMDYFIGNTNDNTAVSFLEQQEYETALKSLLLLEFAQNFCDIPEKSVEEMLYNYTSLSNIGSNLIPWLKLYPSRKKDMKIGLQNRWNPKDMGSVLAQGVLDRFLNNSTLSDYFSENSSRATQSGLSALFLADYFLSDSLMNINHKGLKDEFGLESIVSEERHAHLVSEHLLVRPVRVLNSIIKHHPTSLYYLKKSGVLTKIINNQVGTVNSIKSTEVVRILNTVKKQDLCSATQLAIEMISENPNLMPRIVALLPELDMSVAEVYIVRAIREYDESSSKFLPLLKSLVKFRPTLVDILCQEIIKTSKDPREKSEAYLNYFEAGGERNFNHLQKALEYSTKPEQVLQRIGLGNLKTQIHRKLVNLLNSELESQSDWSKKSLAECCYLLGSKKGDHDFALKSARLFLENRNTGRAVQSYILASRKNKDALCEAFDKIHEGYFDIEEVVSILSESNKILDTESGWGRISKILNDSTQNTSTTTPPDSLTLAQGFVSYKTKSYDKAYSKFKKLIPDITDLEFAEQKYKEFIITVTNAVNEEYYIESLSQAKSLEDQGLLTQARAKAKQARNIFSDREDGYLVLARILRKMGYYSDAINLIDELKSDLNFSSDELIKEYSKNWGLVKTNYTKSELRRFKKHKKMEIGRTQFKEYWRDRKQIMKKSAFWIEVIGPLWRRPPRIYLSEE